MPRSPHPSTTRPYPLIPRREWLILAAIVLLAAALRLAFPGRMAVDHFDEGVYASNIFFSDEEGRRYPYRHLYAPPLLPWLIEWGVVFLGPESIAPFLPALVLGTATVPLAWWAARCWFGPMSGLAAALLIATSDFHLLYSRTALTDAPVAFFLLLAVYLSWEAVRRESLRWSAAAGAAAALAWWTKYTGWLPLAIAASGTAAWLLSERRTGGVGLLARAKRPLACLAVTILTAFALWSPVLWGLEPYGGYAAVAANHRGYLQSAANWPVNAWEQGGNVAAQSGALTALTLAALAALIPLRAPWPLGFRLAASLWAAAVVGCTAYEIGPVMPLAVVAFLGLTLELATSVRPAANEPGPTDLSARRLAAWLLLAWMTGLTLTTPLYHPYPRLMMPWLLAALLAAATWGRPVSNTARRPIYFAASLLVLPAAWLLSESRVVSSREPWFTAGWTVPGWQDRTGTRDAARELARLLERDRPAGEPAVVYVASGPPLFFHMRSLLPDTVAVLPIAGRLDPDRIPRDLPAYVLLNDTQVSGSPENNPAADLSLRPVGVVDRLSRSLVRLDATRTPSAATEPDRRREFLLRLLP